MKEQHYLVGRSHLLVYSHGLFVVFINGQEITYIFRELDTRGEQGAQNDEQSQYEKTLSSVGFNPIIYMDKKVRQCLSVKLFIVDRIGIDSYEDFQ